MSRIIKNMQFQSLEPKQSDGHKKDNDSLLNNIPISYSVNVGSGEIIYKDLKNITENQLLPLNISSGELFTLCIGNGNQKKVALGEIVELNEELFFRVKKFL